MRGLFVGVGELEERRLAIRFTEKGDAGRLSLVKPEGTVIGV